MTHTIRTIVYSAALLLSISPVFSQALTGVKTVGGSSPDYATLAAAVTALNTNGVGTGGVIFNVRDGVYTENISITADGTSSDPITFQSENLDASLVTISSSAAADIITLTGANYITFNKLTIDYAGISGYSAVELQNSSDNITITDCILDGSTTTGTTYTSSVIYAAELNAVDDCNNFVLENCVVRNGSYGLSFDMSTTQPGGLMVMNNEFENNYAGALYLKELTAIMVEGNSIHNSESANSSRYAMNIDNCDGQNLITKNYIYTESGGRFEYGIAINGCASVQGSEGLIANNSVQIENGTSICHGIYQSNNSNYYKIYNNTVYISGGTSTGTVCYTGYPASNDTKVVNNIFVNASTATSVSSNRTGYYANASGYNDIDYNCYWTANTGNPFRGYYGTAYSVFSTFIAATGETNSLNIDPVMTFVADKGWKASNLALIGTGLNLAEVTDDVDKTPRVTPTSIGAHELDVTTSVNENNQTAVTVYEWNRTLFIKSNDAKQKEAELILMDISGSKILSQNIDLSATSQVDISGIATGIYFVSIYNQNAVFTTKLFVK